MPLTVNVGLSRKVTEDYNSKGFTLNIAAELPASLIEDPNGLAQATNNLFALAGDLLEEQVRNASNIGDPTPIRSGDRQPRLPQTTNDRGPSNGNGNGHAGGNGNGGNGHDGPRPATQAQVRAIYNMSKRLNQNADGYAQQEFNVPVRQLSIKQASQMIEALKAGFEAQPAGAAQ